MGSSRSGIALALLTLAGCGSADPVPITSSPSGAPTGQTGNVIDPPIASPRGTWAMFTSDSDYLVVDLEDQGSTITGFGCYSGLPQDPTFDPATDESCGELFGGQIYGSRVKFGFEVTANDVITYWNEVFIDRDARRMAGIAAFETGSYAPAPTLAVWLPLGPDQGWLTANLEWPEQILWRNGDEGYDLTLEAANGGTEFVAGKTYRLQRERNGLVGDLGAFWASELAFGTDGDGQLMLMAGPVPETSPELPVLVALTFSSTNTLMRVEAHTPSGAAYTFAAAWHTDP